jgi:hypothetical protein
MFARTLQVRAYAGTLVGDAMQFAGMCDMQVEQFCRDELQPVFDGYPGLDDEKAELKV